MKIVIEITTGAEEIISSLSPEGKVWLTHFLNDLIQRLTPRDKPVK